MELRSRLERSSRQNPPSPWGLPPEARQGRHQRSQQRLARRLLCLPLAGLITLVLIGCVGRPPSSSPKRRLHQGGSSGLHNLNRGRIGAHPTAEEHPN